MDEEHTAGFSEPCAVCSAVDWGVSDEGRFYCRSCHNVIERTREVVDTTTMSQGSSRISTMSRGRRTKRVERGRQWVVCEGFQFILQHQADALLALGVDPRFKDQVLCQMWRRYLQRSRQAFTHNPVRTNMFGMADGDSGSESAAEASVQMSNETDEEGNVSGTSNNTGSSSWSLRSGSNTTPRLRPEDRRLMSMRKTLALLHIALIWTREPLTLSDLLRLVKEGHVPYVHAYEKIPEEMKLEGKDALIFRVKSVPSYQVVHSEAQTLLLFLELPAFPPISRQSLLHPALLSLRYLMDANLPDELHPWVCRLMECAGMADAALIQPPRAVLPRYDLQAAALVVVTMKLLFGMNDCTEWELSDQAADQDHAGGVFSLRRWFRLLQGALRAARRRSQSAAARRRWAARRPLHAPSVQRCVVMKRKRTAEQVQSCFEKLTSRAAWDERGEPSSFRFLWGDEDGADGPSLHHQTLHAVLSQRSGVPTPLNATYWHPSLNICDPRKCSGHYSEASLPHAFVWLMQLFCFLLDVTPQSLYEEVLEAERRLVPPRTRTRTRTRTQQGQKPAGPEETRTRTRGQKNQDQGQRPAEPEPGPEASRTRPRTRTEPESRAETRTPQRTRSCRDEMKIRGTSVCSGFTAQNE